MLLFAHEGRQWKVDRVWLIKADGQSQPVLVHQRTMKMEIAVHEYWSNDGQMIWYDLQTPLSEDFWVGGYNPYTDQRIWYHLPPNTYRSVHYNTSPDGTLFSGDGSGTDPCLLYTSPTAAPVRLVKRDHQTTIRVRMRRGPFRSAAAPVGISNRA